MHATTARPVLLAYPGASDAPPARHDFSLVCLKPSADCFEALSFDPATACLQLSGLGAGSYQLTLKRYRATIDITVVACTVQDGFLLAAHSTLSAPNCDPGSLPLSIVNCSSQGDQVAIRLSGASPTTRVHVVATQCIPHTPLAQA